MASAVPGICNCQSAPSVLLVESRVDGSELTGVRCRSRCRSLRSRRVCERSRGPFRRRLDHAGRPIRGLRSRSTTESEGRRQTCSHSGRMTVTPATPDAPWWPATCRSVTSLRRKLRRRARRLARGRCRFSTDTRGHQLSRGTHAAHLSLDCWSSHAIVTRCSPIPYRYVNEMTVFFSLGISTPSRRGIQLLRALLKGDGFKLT